MSNIKITKTGWNPKEYDLDDLPAECVKIKFVSGLTGKLTNNLNEIFYWCDTLGVEAELVATTVDEDFNDIVIWKIINPEHKTMFILRWK